MRDKNYKHIKEKLFNFFRIKVTLMKYEELTVVIRFFGVIEEYVYLDCSN